MITKYGDKYIVKKNDGLKELISKSIKIFETYEDAEMYDNLINSVDDGSERVSSIVYFDNEPFLKESDLIKSEENEDNYMKIEELDSKISIEKSEKDEKSAVNHPKHYQNDGGLETIDEMILLFGLEETMIFCKLNAWKYRARATKKGSEKEDLEKANWYILKYAELKKRSEEHDYYQN